MITQHVELSRKNAYSGHVHLNPDFPYLEILYIQAVSNNKGKKASLINELVLAYQCFDGHGNYVYGNIDLHFTRDSNRNITISEIDEKINIPAGYNEFRLNITLIEDFEIHLPEDFALVVYYKTVNVFVDLKEPSESFKVHIDQTTNSKILFSGEFGQGKTTFLNHFFEENDERYSVIKVFPVNYSVSSNEDIFRYIKCDILFQLLNKDLEFSSTQVSYTQSAESFLKDNAHKVIAAFLSMVPKVGKNIYEIFNRLDDLKEKYLEFHDGQQTDDFETAKEYLQLIYDKDGGIFEENFYTQLIRELLKQIEENEDKRTVLLIEDLDRIDPDHIFRILNVISAHYDNQFNDQDNYNKFGFNKIIIVCDLNNIRNIFHYRYGPDVNFNGYINKFFSKTPFSYDNNDAVIEIMRHIEETLYEMDIHKELSSYYDIIHLILHDLIKTKQISLREILKLKSQNFGSVYERRRFGTITWERQLNTIIYPIIDYFCAMGGASLFSKKIHNCLQELGYRDNNDVTYFIPYMLPMSRVNTLEVYNTRTYYFEVAKDDKRINYAFNIKETVGIGGMMTQPSFSISDFYHVLLKNIEVYTSIKNS